MKISLSNRKLENKVRDKEIPTKQDLKKQYLIERKTAEEIGEKYGASQGSALRWLRHYEIPIRSPQESRLENPLARIPTKEELIEDYIIKRKNGTWIAKKYKVSPGVIYGALEEYKIETRKNNESKFLFHDAKIPTKKELLELYIKDKKTIAEIGEICKVSSAVISDRLDKFRISKRSLSESKLAPDAKIPTKKELIRWYVKEWKSVQKIAEMCKVSSPIILNKLRAYHIPVGTRLLKLLLQSKILTEDKLKDLYLIKKNLSLIFLNVTKQIGQ